MYSTPDEAEQAFYQAFENADLAAMMQIWADDDTIACAHPMGKLLQGRTTVRESWRQLFSGDQRMHFRLQHQQIRQSETIAVHSVLETIFLHGDNRPRPPIIATNVFVRTDGGWRMVLHHASPSVIDNTQPESGEDAPPPLH